MMERKIKRKDFKQKIEWLLDNKDKISRCRRNFYIDALGERYSDFIPYEKYGKYGEGIREYIRDLHSARLRKAEKETVQQYLSSLHAKQLLNLRDKVYAVSNNGGNLPVVPSIVVDGKIRITINEIKAELARRPHVPNAAEAKIIRQQKAKEKQNR